MFSIFMFVLDPKAGRYIYNIFNKNVSDYYEPKPDILKAMEIEILRKRTRSFRTRPTGYRRKYYMGKYS